MNRRLLASLFFVLTVSWGLAQTFVVFPVQSPDTLLGFAVADRISREFIDEFDEIVGPEIAVSLVPPLPVGTNYLSPGVFLKDRSFNNQVGAVLARELFGADFVLTGEVINSQNGLILKLYLAGVNGVNTHTVRSAVSQPGLLIDKAVAIVATRLDLRKPEIGSTFVSSNVERDYLSALNLISRGFLEDARALLAQMDSHPGAARLRRNLAAVFSRKAGDDPGLQATMSLNSLEFSETLAIKYFRDFADNSSLLAPRLWIAILSASNNDLDSAIEAFDLAAAEHPYGVVARANFRASRGLPGVEEDILKVLGQVKEGAVGVGTLLGLAVVADYKADIVLEQTALEDLNRIQPDFLYPYERLSFIAFEQEDFFDAHSALLKAVHLDPDNDLYWTNLGWAYYLIGLLDKSEEASLRAVQLNPQRFTAFYNLGLMQVLTGRLELAVEQYRRAVSLSSEVDPNAIIDLLKALEKYPDQQGIHYALGYLYERQGKHLAAADQYEIYLNKTGNDLPLTVFASKRILALRAPPAAIAINNIIEICLGQNGISAAPYHPGDTIYPRFEVITEGEALPDKLQISINLLDRGGLILRQTDGEVSVPYNAVGLVIDQFGLDIPLTLDPGSYELRVSVNTSEQRFSHAAVTLTVKGSQVLLRQLISRNIQMLGIRAGRFLFGPRNLSRPELLPRILVQELRSAAEEAEKILPEAKKGRFEGMSGGKLFADSTERDVRDFLRFLLSQRVQDTELVFAEAYAKWALDGAPLY